jgi:2-polyprenyl-3-methyl-5-hydroxy-6-metoxy-1,4-benzoquinol methylase
MGKKPWAETRLFKDLEQRYKCGEIAQGIRTEADLLKMGEQIKKLAEDISINGFKLQKDLSMGNRHPLLKLDDVAINIGRNGDAILVDGLHRLVIAQLLKLRLIPVRVCVRHSDWEDMRKMIAAIAQQDGGYVYQKMHHPDLEDIPFYYGDDRLAIIKPHLPLAPASVLDIGANWGYFCQNLCREGYECTAVENDPEHLYFLKRFRDISKLSYDIIGKSVFDISEPLEYDVVFALSIFHHFIKHKNTHEQLVTLLRRLKAKVVFFQPNIPDSEQSKSHYRSYEPDEFADLVKGHLGLQRVERIGQAPDGRPLFKIT